MSRSDRYFYVIYSADSACQHALDTLRYIADPNERMRAHITLRGPIRTPTRMSVAKRRTTGKSICVSGVDTFFGPSQNTVYLRCEAPDLEPLWHKPNHKGFTPHITLYDGKSRHFASALTQVLEHHHLSFSFPASDLQEWAPIRGQSTLDLAASYDELLVQNATGRTLTVEQIRTLSEQQRLDLIDRICAFAFTESK